MKRFLLVIIFLVFGAGEASAFVQKVQFKHRKLELAGDFPWFPGSPLEISGVADGNKPFKFTLTIASDSGHGYYKASYKLDYQGENSSGELLGRFGETNKMSTGSKDKKADETTFSLMVDN